MDKVKEALIGIFGIAFVIAFFGGIIWFIWWDYNTDSAQYAAQCKNIAELANVTEYKANYSDCYIVKDGKIVEIEL